MQRVIHVYHEESDEMRAPLARLLPDWEIVFGKDIGAARFVFAGMPPTKGWSRELELLQIMGVGADHFLFGSDIPARAIVAGARGLFAREVSEHAIMMMLALARSMPAIVHRQERGEWNQFASPTLAGKTLGVVGLGEIGRRISAIAERFEMRVLGCSRTRGHLESLAKEADHLVVCVPLTESTRHLVSARILDAMKPTAFVINVSRGGTIDEDALRRALEEGRIGGAALDVFSREPLAKDDPWWRTPNTIVSSHTAGVGLHYVERTIERLAENIRRFEKGEPLLGVIDRALGY